MTLSDISKSLRSCATADGNCRECSFVDYKPVLSCTSRLMLAAADCMDQLMVGHVADSHWYLDPDGMDWGIPAWRCSGCEALNHNIPANAANPMRFVGSRYCPNCGAKMRNKERTERWKTTFALTERKPN